MWPKSVWRRSSRRSPVSLVVLFFLSPLPGIPSPSLILAFISNLTSKNFRGRTSDYGIAASLATSKNAGFPSN